jgi:hypothetical protein
MGREAAVVVAEEYQIAGGRERAAVVRIFQLQPDLGFAGRRVERFETAVEALGRLACAAREPLARLDRAALVDEILLLDGLDGIAALDRGYVEQVELGIVGAGLPVLAACNATGIDGRWWAWPACRGCLARIPARRYWDCS